MTLKTIIGLEIHVELSTDTKMFCSCKNEFGKAPNTNVCPVCLGHPGALPVINKKAIEYAVMAGLAFDCEIREEFKMDRKKYFYPDLVKGYQISQDNMPLCENGKIDLHLEDYNKTVRIQRIHIEEDTGKSIHNEAGNTLMDYNRSGVPLIEIVTYPDMNTTEEARLFLETLRERLKYLGVSDVRMEEGSLRCDVNINVIDEETGFKTKISEIKNLNSFKSAVKALEFEEKRHRKLIEEKNEGFKETRRWDDGENATVVMRRKEEGSDYRLSVEGDIPYIRLGENFIEDIKNNLPELPHDKMNRFIEEYKIEEYDADILTRNVFLSNYFEKVVSIVNDAQLVSNWLLSTVLRQVNDNEIEVEDMNMSAENLAKLLNLVKDKKINNNTAKKTIRKMFIENFDPEKYVKEQGLVQITDDSALVGIVEEVLANNQQSIEDFKNGKDRALGYLVGQCMKASRGKGNPQKFNEMLLERLNA